ELDLRLRLMHEQRLRRPFARYGLAVDGDDPLADLRLHADRVERRVGDGIPRIAADDALDRIARAIVGELQLGGEMAERHGRRLAVVAAHFIRVRRAELALELPDKV